MNDDEPARLPAAQVPSPPAALPLAGERQR